MAIEKKLVDFFDHSGGVNALESEAILADNEYLELNNIELSTSKTLKKRKGGVQKGDIQAATSIKHLDRYVTEDYSTLIKSQDKLLYKLDESTGVSSSFVIETVASSLSNYSNTNKTIDINFVATHGFLVDDEIFFTVSGSDYVGTTTEILSTTSIRIKGIVSDISQTLTPNISVYGGRLSDVIPVVSVTNFVANDMVTITGFCRNFKILSKDAGTNTLTIDEEIYIKDSASSPTVTVESRWQQFEEDVDIQKDEILDYSATQPIVSSSQLRKTLYLTDGENEPLGFDGLVVNRLGFCEPISPLFNETETGTGGNNLHSVPIRTTGGDITDAGYRRYLLTYNYYDNNGELVESSPCYFANSYIPSGTSTNLAILAVPTIELGYNYNQLYDLNNITIDVYRTITSPFSSTDATTGTDFYKIISAPITDIFSFSTTSITVDGGNYRISTAGQPASFYDRFDNVDYLVLTNVGTTFAGAAKNLTVAISSINEGSEYIVINNVQDFSGNADTITTGSLGLCYVPLVDTFDDEGITSQAVIYTNRGQEDSNEKPPLAKYVTMWENRPFFANIKTDNYKLIRIDPLYLPNGIGLGSFSISDGTTTHTFNMSNGVPTNPYLDIPFSDYASIDYFLHLKRICDAINSHPSGLCWAYYLDRTGEILLIERQRTSGIKIKFNLSDTSKLKYIKMGSHTMTASDNNVYFNFDSDQYPSRVCWGKTAELASFVGVFGDPNTQTTFYEDVYPDNGEVITGIIALPTMMVVFKEDSCFRMNTTGTDAYSVELIDSSIGCIAPKSIILLGNKVIFLSRHGVYMTDGYFVNFVGEKLQNYWNNLDMDYIQYSCSTHYVGNSQYWLSAPYKEEGSDSQTTNNRVFVYDYTNNLWSVYDIEGATLFAKREDIINWSSSSGQVMQLRDCDDFSDFRDDSSAITGTIITKWYDFNMKSVRKMFQTIIPHLYQKGNVSNNINVYVSYDFNEAWEFLGSVDAGFSPWGYYEYGVSPWGSVTIEPKKLSLSPQKNIYVRFKFENSTKDEVIEMLGHSIEFKVLNTQAVKQEE